jgi:hypothetical protein
LQDYLRLTDETIHKFVAMGNQEMKKIDNPELEVPLPSVDTAASAPQEQVDLKKLEEIKVALLSVKNLDIITKMELEKIDWTSVPKKIKLELQQIDTNKFKLLLEEFNSKIEEVNSYLSQVFQNEYDYFHRNKIMVFLHDQNIPDTDYLLGHLAYFTCTIYSRDIEDDNSIYDKFRELKSKNRRTKQDVTKFGQFVREYVDTLNDEVSSSQMPPAPTWSPSDDRLFGAYVPPQPPSAYSTTNTAPVDDPQPSQPVVASQPDATTPPEAETKLLTREDILAVVGLDYESEFNELPDPIKTHLRSLERGNLQKLYEQTKEHLAKVHKYADTIYHPSCTRYFRLLPNLYDLSISKLDSVEKLVGILLVDEDERSLDTKYLLLQESINGLKAKSRSNITAQEFQDLGKMAMDLVDRLE